MEIRYFALNVKQNHQHVGQKFTTIFTNHRGPNSIVRIAFLKQTHELVTKIDSLYINYA